MQDSTATLIAASVPVLTGAGYLGFLLIRFFTRMDTKVSTTGENVTRLIDNHIPHIYDRLGHIEGTLETRKDPPSN